MSITLKIHLTSVYDSVTDSASLKSSPAPASGLTRFLPGLLCPHPMPCPAGFPWILSSALPLSARFENVHSRSFPIANISGGCRLTIIVTQAEATTFLSRSRSSCILCVTMVTQPPSSGASHYTEGKTQTPRRALTPLWTPAPDPVHRAPRCSHGAHRGR